MAARCQCSSSLVSSSAASMELIAKCIYTSVSMTGNIAEFMELQEALLTYLERLNEFLFRFSSVFCSLESLSRLVSTNGRREFLSIFHDCQQSVWAMLDATASLWQEMLHSQSVFEKRTPSGSTSTLMLTVRPRLVQVMETACMLLTKASLLRAPSLVEDCSEYRYIYVYIYIHIRSCNQYPAYNDKTLHITCIYLHHVH